MSKQSRPWSRQQRARIRRRTDGQGHGPLRLITFERQFKRFRAGRRVYERFSVPVVAWDAP